MFYDLPLKLRWSGHNATTPSPTLARVSDISRVLD